MSFAMRNITARGFGNRVQGIQFLARDSTLLSLRRRGQLGRAVSWAAIPGAMEPNENFKTNQLLKTKASKELRVICATPANKRASRPVSKRFLCCLCISVR
jgi:hypothetical protein